MDNSKPSSTYVQHGPFVIIPRHWRIQSDVLSEHSYEIVSNFTT